MGPTSLVVLIGLLVVAVALMVAMVRLRWIAVKAGLGALVLVVSMTCGLVLVNDYYGYYRSWSDLGHDLSNASPHTLVVTGARRGRTVVQSGRVVSFTFDGKQSGLSRPGLVYLPPQYSDPRYRSVKFPVLELLHGYPGKPSDWIYALHLNTIADRQIALRRLGPMVIVIPPISSGNSAEECLNTPRAQDATFLTHDVRTDILAKFRVSADPAEWGLAGFSSGGYCAMNLALQNRSFFGSAAALDGYYQAGDGPAARLLGNDPALMALNSPVTEASRLATGTVPVPSLWLSVGTGNADDRRQAKNFVNAIGPVENATLVTLPRQGHNFYAWQSVLPETLNWSWQQLSPPDLRVYFPVSGTSSELVVPLPPRQHRLPYPGTPTPAPPTPTAPTAPAAPGSTTSGTTAPSKTAAPTIRPTAAVVSPSL
jgi:poly(3-hydroxybutyrate) depolymerase